MVIYFDGGCFKDPNNKGFGKHRTICISYGIVLHCNEQDPVEANGGYTMKCSFDSMHEHIAFLEAFKLLKSRNIDYKKVSFYTDAQEVAYAQSFLHKENYHPYQKEKLIGNLNKCIKLLGIEKYKEEILDCLNNSLFIKVKGHNGLIDNLRVDYLARKHFHKGVIQPYNDYIKQFDFPFNRKEYLLHHDLGNTEPPLFLNKNLLLSNIQKLKESPQNITNKELTLKR